MLYKVPRKMICVSIQIENYCPNSKFGSQYEQSELEIQVAVAVLEVA